MKKIATTLLLLSVVTLLHAVPAKPGQWKTITLPNGTEVRVQLKGDEHAKWWQAEDGSKYVFNQTTGAYSPIDAQTLQARSMSKRLSAARAQAKARKAPRKIGHVDKSIFQGQKKGLIILVQFTDSKFQSGHDVALYEKIANAENYKDNGFYGSVRDYFKAQSGGQFDLQFDVKGIVTLNHPYSYYGGNDSNDNDQNPGEMITDALEAIKNEVNFADYDWNNDGEAEEVFVLYAGKGEANGGDANTVWPHMWSLEEANGEKWSHNGISVDIYACSCELNGYSQLDGVGTFCHEFSHCMGFPDMYDTEYNGNFGMGDWDLMCGGSYNGNGRIPAGYSCYEKMETGWLNPIELTEETSVNSLKTTADGGDAYIVYNKAHTDECYMIENRQQTGWDSSLPGKGMLIHYIDYDQTVWEYNIPNTICDYTSYAQRYPEYYDFYINYKNDHERLTIFHADNNDDSSSRYGGDTQSTDAYPYNGNDSLTNNSRPAAKLYHANVDGGKYMNIAITDIKQNNDGTMSFNFRPTEGKSSTKPDHTDAIFYESFDQCAGIGGNDDIWNGSNTGNATLTADANGWQYTYGRGANECARFGSSRQSGAVTTPSFTVNGETTFTFMAAPWSGDGTSLALSVSGGATISPASFTLTDGDWTTCTATITGTGNVQVTFTPAKRFFLDEVVAKSPTSTGISTVVALPTQQANAAWYTIDGRQLNAQPTQKGIYIKGGKKIIVK